MIDDSLEKKHWAQKQFLVGVDEAGLGCVAGSCFVAGVAFPRGYDFSKKLAEVNDSKKLTETKRNELVQVIKKEASRFFVKKITAGEIDAGSAYHLRFDAARSGIKETFADMKCVIYMDGNAVIKYTDKIEYSLIKGDTKCYSIAAASILAKTAKDSEMRELDKILPAYGFASNKGYASKTHIDAIIKNGVSWVHRKTFCTRFK